MPDGLYDRDVLAWSERQAALLRRLAAGERLNEAVDWPNVIEELQDVGVSELRAVRGLLRQALLHLMKLQAWPDNPACPHWRGETVGFLVDAQDRFSPSMVQRVGLQTLYGRTLIEVQARSEAFGPGRRLPLDCPFSLDDLLVDPVDLLALSRRFAKAMPEA